MACNHLLNIRRSFVAFIEFLTTADVEKITVLLNDVDECFMILTKSRVQLIIILSLAFQEKLFEPTNNNTLKNCALL